MNPSAERGREYLDRLASQRITPADVAEYLQTDAEHHIHSANHYLDETLALIEGQDDPGDFLPWKKTHQDFRLRPGEVTLWHGINGHGKSAVTAQVALWLSLQKRSCCLASFEMLPKRTLERMAKQAAGNPEPTRSLMIDFFYAVSPYLWIYDRQGRVDPNYLFAAMRFAADKRHAKHFFVDSLMKCVPKEDDYSAQSNFVNSLCDVAHETGMHIHLIHHVRKGENEERVPSKFDAKGTGAITDQVDNVVAVWRNKKKERENREAAEMGQALTNETPDFLLICDKQRNGGWEGAWALWGDVKSWHFRETPKEPWVRGYELPSPKEAA